MKAVGSDPLPVPRVPVFRSRPVRECSPPKRIRASMSGRERRSPPSENRPRRSASSRPCARARRRRNESRACSSSGPSARATIPRSINYRTAVAAGNGARPLYLRPRLPSQASTCPKASCCDWSAVRSPSRWEPSTNCLTLAGPNSSASRRFPHNHGKRFAAIWSAASRSRSLPFHRSR